MSDRDGHDVWKNNQGKKLTVILDEFDFTYTDEELDLAAQMYNEGKTLREIAGAVRPKLPEDFRITEAALLIIHLGWKNKVNPKNRAKDFWG